MPSVGMYRVTTLIGGPYVQGGGIAQHYFDDLGGSVNGAITAVGNFWTAVLSLVGSGTTFAVQGTVEQVRVTDGAITAVLSGTATTKTGTGGTTLLPLATQVVAQWRTGVYSDGREIRGRTFIPALITTVGTTGVPTSGTQTTVAAAGAALIADANCELVVYRRERLASDALGSPGMPGYRSAKTHRDGISAVAATCSSPNKYAVLRSRRD
jgi:hypothetical protein